jgi:hypothetical protein
VDDADTKRVKRDLVLAQNLGLIRVAVHRFRVSGGRKPLKDGDNHKSLTLSFAEKALKDKAVSHGTT